MKKEELDEILRLHKLWLNDDPSGRCADLRNADLSHSNLNGARLDGASLDGARLDGASLNGASLDGASLKGASLDGARLKGASLDGASLKGATLVGARLDGASLDGASLKGATLVGAKTSRGTIIRAMGWIGLYAYWVFAQETDQGQFIRMGCKERSRAEWEADFWNNPKEFPNDGSEQSKLRYAAFQYACAWLDAVKK